MSPSSGLLLQVPFRNRTETETGQSRSVGRHFMLVFATLLSIVARTVMHPVRTEDFLGLIWLLTGRRQRTLAWIVAIDLDGSGRVRASGDVNDNLGDVCQNAVNKPFLINLLLALQLRLSPLRQQLQNSVETQHVQNERLVQRNAWKVWRLGTGKQSRPCHGP